VLAIANGERPNRQYESDDEDSESELDIEANPNPSTQDRCGSDDETSRLSEAEELFESAKQTIASLFRISIIIRKASPRDRFVKALSAKQTPFDDSFDISHVGNKFPLLRSDDKRWLKERLGKAIAQRRQYLRYARDHRHKLSKEPTELWQPGIVEDPSIQVPVADWSARSQAAHTNFTKPSSTLAPTTASTLHIASIPPPEKDFQDDISQTSYAVSLGEENDDSHLQLPRLTDISNGATTFECPLCWTIQSIHKETAWKKHGYTDLRPYVCTFQECDLKLFSDRRDWFDHEMQHHRAKWDCHFCGKGNFNSLDRFEVHLRSFHAQDATDDQLDALGEACKSPVDRIAASDCPFCEDWERKLLQANADISTNETIVVTPSQFKHHVGSHMQVRL
jgi:hypothetical protein